ncbi:MAG: cold shock domain-containing protein [Bacteroidota bacterium]
MNFIEKVKSLLFNNENRNENNNRQNTSSNEYKGAVVRFDHSRGYGFIHSKDFDQLVFLHISDVEVKVRRGQNVKFDVEKSRKGWKAINVKVEGAW